MKKIEEIQYITQDSEQLTHAEQALLMYKNGIKWVQLRMKNHTPDELTSEALIIKKYAKQYNGKLIINDYVDIALNVKADAIHLGLNDMPADEARKILGDDIIIGGTANTIKDVMLQVSRGVDYVGLGPFRFTNTKKNLSPVIGLDGYKKIIEELHEKNCFIPVIAVGGISLDDIDKIKNTGIHGVAISGALLESVLK